VVERLRAVRGLQVDVGLGVTRRAECRETMMHGSIAELCGGRHTFYPEDRPPPDRVLDVSGKWER
jgi:hypothetical protein